MTKEFQKNIFRYWSERNDFFLLNLDPSRFKSVNDDDTFPVRETSLPLNARMKYATIAKINFRYWIAIEFRMTRILYSAQH